MDKLISLKLPEELIEEIKKAAKEDYLNMSSFIRVQLRKVIEDRHNERGNRSLNTKD